MSISAISAGTVLASTGVDSVASDIRALQSAISQGNITVAQTAFATLQAALSSMPKTAPQAKQFTQNTQLGQAFDALRSALQQGDISGTQDAYSAVQSALKTGAVAAAASASEAVAVASPATTSSPAALASEASAGEESTVGTALNTVA